MQQDELRIGHSVRPFVRPIAGASGSETALTRKCQDLVDIPALNALALRSLTSLYEPARKLFVRGATWSANGVYRQPTSPKRTAIALLGLQKLVKAGSPVPFNLAAITTAVLEDTSWVASLADLGLLAWVTATLASDRLPKLFVQFDFDRAMERHADGRQARTLGLAWFLAGLSHVRLADSASMPDLTDTAANAYHLLLENQAESGLFGHAAFPGLLGGLCSKRFGTFGDQIHAIYALATFARAFQVDEPLEPALRAANSIRALQGELGEWWFLYNKRTSQVVKRYPVCCCHQSGTAPMGLAALEETTGRGFPEAISRGLLWIGGANALQNDLRSPERGLIWDSIRQRHRGSRYLDTTIRLLRASKEHPNEELSVCYEARPDLYGWLLAGLGDAGLPEASPGLR
jgi:hypothetical protein